MTFREMYGYAIPLEENATTTPHLWVFCLQNYGKSYCDWEMNRGVCSLQGPAIDTLREIEAFLAANPLEIVTVILEDYVKAPKALTKIFTEAGLMKYWFPVSSMPQNGEDWPLVSDMVAKNQRLIVFTSIKSKQETEGIAYQWNYMVENQCT